MSAVVKCTVVPEDGMTLSLVGSEVLVDVTDGRRSHRVLLARTDFLAAISSELGVVIIDKADLPEVDVAWADAVRGDGQTAAEVRKSALVRLALADYLDARPPVDEAQVDALAATIGKATGTAPYAYISADLTPSALARSIIASGDVEVRA